MTILHANPEKVFRSLAILFLNCRFKELRKVYLASLNKYAGPLGSDACRRIINDISETHAKP